MMTEPDFSLVLATIGKKDAVHRFLDSLVLQNNLNLELIIVDQNEDDRLDGLRNIFKDRFIIKHLRTHPGVSKARNLGISKAVGRIIGFPDDDCEYPEGLLSGIKLRIEREDLAGISGRAVDFHGNQYARFDRAPGLITMRNVWQRTATFSLFLRARVFDDVNGFDEELGPGAGTPWGGAEDIDLPLRIVKAGYDIYYDPEIIVNHPNPFEKSFSELASRAYQYGAGIGRVWRKHEFPLWLVCYHIIRPLGGAILSFLSLNSSKSRYHWNAFRGRLYGYLSKL